MMRQLLFVALALVIVIQLADAGNCKKELADAQANPAPGQFIPRCDDNGDYKKAQCNGSTGYCYCVDPKTGKKVGKSKRGGVKCH